MAAKQECDFQTKVIQMNGLLENGHIHGAIECAKEALQIHCSDEIERKLSLMMEFVRKNDVESNDARDHLGYGFYMKSSLASKLQDYQKVGVLWLWDLFNKEKGGILGDTALKRKIQIVAFVTALFQMRKVKSVLIVVPVATIEAWKEDFQAWASELNVFDYRTGYQRKSILKKVQFEGGVVLSTYGVLRPTSSEDSTISLVWDYLILEDCHKVKSGSKSAQVILNTNAKHRIVVATLKIPNHLNELWTVLGLINEQGLIGTEETFKRDFEKPISQSLPRNASEEELKLGNDRLDILHQMIGPYFLRRTINDVVSGNIEFKFKFGMPLEWRPFAPKNEDF